MKYFISIFSIIALITYSTTLVKAEEKDSNNIMLTSEAAVLMDAETGSILFEKNSDAKMYPASLTKIATAIYAIEKGKLDENVVISEKAVNTEGTSVYLEPGELVPLKKLVQGMLINSGNDAAVAIAEYLNGNVEDFSFSLNEYLKNEIGVENTHFTNPNGLFGENHYTTAKDMAIITKYALQNETFREIFGTKELVWDGQSWDTTLVTHHRLLKGEVPFKQRITGGKTGFIDESKQTLATTAENDEINLVAIVLKADTKRKIYKDTVKLLEYGFAHFKSGVIKDNTIYKKNGIPYQVLGDQQITEELNGKTSKTVTADGELQLTTNAGKVLQTLKLKVIKPPKPAEVEGEYQQAKILADHSINNITAFMGYLFMCLAFLFVIKKIRLRMTKTR
ncbi:MULTISPECIES: D-alanyl-D-alanine carboxypeptidase family protein [unclassified Bacillus (in: firmicutes)]|uniref:D-alanyl-D-alanine carboxypeptidase family protein n=1 Tax=unclassified Bacillus (in: firmicutes) TaxID=185979 RepID=UPI0008E29214|nr:MULTISPECIES: D-alanyl-D-alanine carboxypeptidase family protein [unclassified Bacillus (in: firmicutes)]SFA91357.1 D-alanyl-D-alanine carboxypeptidase [Bacillus sp. UNCCL13]SFQ85560.1 D-alanyl-D-alanine carboxypeptidase [Bacillus sp. cl95]